MLSKLVNTALIAAAGCLSFAPAAFSENAGHPEAVAQAAQSLEESLPSRFISDGSVLTHDRTGMRITPPTSWEVVSRPAGLTYIFQEAQKSKVKDRLKFQRNITVSANSSPLPMDDESLKEIKTKIEEAAKKDVLVKDFQFLEAKFFDFRDKNDAILIYTSMYLGEFPMMQMHVVVSGAESHFLLSFTDVAERFTKDEGAYQEAWASMTSIEVNGQPPARWEQFKIYGIIGAALLLALLLLNLLRRALRKPLDYAEEANSVYADVPSSGGSDLGFTRSMVWNLKTGSEEAEDIAFEQSSHQKRAGGSAGNTAFSAFSDFY